jgi:hypothetical protein
MIVLYKFDLSPPYFRLSLGEYLESELSTTFDDIPVRDIIPQFLELSLRDGRSAAMRDFRAWMQTNLASR